MPPVRRTLEAEVVLVDTSVFIRFAKQDKAFALCSYLGPRLRVARDVRDELSRHIAERRYHGALKALDLVRELTPERALDIPSELQTDAVRALRLSQAPGDHPRRNAGEVASVYCGLGLSGAGRRVLLALDDRGGKALAARHRLTWRSTEQLAGEMVLGALLEEDIGFRIYDSSTRDGIGRREWEELLETLRGDQ